MWSFVDPSRHRHALAALVLAWAWNSACTGGTRCPDTPYTPSGEEEPDCDAGQEACLADTDSCWLQCGQGTCSPWGCSCEPCADVRAWAAAECPDCLEEEQERMLTLGCTTE